LPWRLVKSGVDKICAMVGEMWCGEVEKEGSEDISLALCVDKLF
jgi:hypothetical protein